MGAVKATNTSPCISIFVRESPTDSCLTLSAKGLQRCVWEVVENNISLKWWPGPSQEVIELFADSIFSTRDFFCPFHKGKS